MLLLCLFTVGMNVGMWCCCCCARCEVDAGIAAVDGAVDVV